MKNAALVTALAGMLLAGCTTGSTAEHATTPAGVTSLSAAAKAASLVGLGEEAAPDTVPWSDVGPGWLLATWSPAVARDGYEATTTVATTLYLVNPKGGRYPLTTFPPPGDAAAPYLEDWSGDGSKALFYDWGTGTNADHTTTLLVDLHTGTQTPVALKAGDTRFTLPDGKALLWTNSPADAGPATLERYDLAGNLQLAYPVDQLDSTFSGSYLSTPDGTRLVLGTSAGLVLMGNDGTVGDSLSVPGQKNCNPVRWWDASTVLASCNVDSESYASRLWLVPVDGSAATALTALNDGSGSPDLADLNAWKLPAGTFVQAASGCGTVYLAKLNPDGSTSKIDVPGTEGSVKVVGVDGDHLVLQANLGCERGESTLDYDPATNTATVLLGPSVNGGGVFTTLAYAGQR